MRYIIFTGLCLTALSLWQMSQFDLQISEGMLLQTGLLQGFGMGCIFVPLSTVAYATLPGRFRNDATAVFSLIRNIGSSVGISLIIAKLTDNISVFHSQLVEFINPFNDALKMPAAAARFSLQSQQSLAALDGLVSSRRP